MISPIFCGKLPNTRTVIDRYNVDGFEDGRKGPRAKWCRQPLEARKGKKTYIPLEALERNAALRMP